MNKIFRQKTLLHIVVLSICLFNSQFINSLQGFSKKNEVNVKFPISQTAVDITSLCDIKSRSRSIANIDDNNISTYYNDCKYDINITIPENIEIGGIYIKWFSECSGYYITAKDQSGNITATYSDDDFCPINQYLKMSRNTKKLQIKLSDKESRISELKIISTCKLPGYIQNWNPPVEKADLMVVSAHQDDELIYFGGTIPYYTIAKKVKTVVVYMADCGRYRREEALDGLWTMGVKDYPSFINLKDKKCYTIEDAKKIWGENDTIENLVKNIRKYKPEVIVSHDINGEYGHGAHKYTAQAVQTAINYAKDATKYPETAQKYGVWSVKKLYLHLYPENRVYMDWNTPLRALNDLSPLKVAQIGYDCHVSQHGRYSVDKGGQYDNAKFGLVFSTVGMDKGKNDFFENIVLP